MNKKLISILLVLVLLSGYGIIFAQMPIIDGGIEWFELVEEPIPTGIQVIATQDVVHPIHIWRHGYDGGLWRLSTQRFPRVDIAAYRVGDRVEILQQFIWDNGTAHGFGEGVEG